MESIWKEWEEHYKRLGIDPKNICKDGIINADETIYNKTNPKIMLVLREVNKWPGGDLRELFRKRPYRIGRVIARWSAGILQEFPEYSVIEKMDDNSLTKELTKIAVINLKKTSGESASDPSVINAYAHQDRDLLLKQIEVIKPDIIIACGTIDPLIWLLDLNTKSDLKPEIVIKDNLRGIAIIPFRHPARDTKPKETYNKLKKMIGGI